MIERYNKKERITFAHIEELLTLNTPYRCSVASFRQFEDKLLTHIRCLEVLGIGGHNYGVILTPLILSRLPTEVRLEWARGGEGKESDLKYLLEFLHSEIRRRERSLAFSESKLSPQISQESKKPAAAAALLSREGTGRCSICSKNNHEASKCRLLTKVSLQKKKTDNFEGKVVFSLSWERSFRKKL